ncbi:H-NS histone family protein [Acinetobacter baumannii]|uniref:H-NS histone family protein n=1 Tax=Acinetobacter baumannii TaxID=470 RepID=UPI0012934F30|nr:H-NS histone family protein [Acinetobacter baumannii]MQQ85430.1 H-NS histone family protein [Acinetobacter baumannii]
MRANWLCGRFCVQASSFENYIAEKPFTDRFVQQSHQIIEIAENVGFSVEQLLEFGAQKRKKTTRKSVEPRYRNKNNAEETWTGRGKQPRWLVAEIEKGAKLEDFLI